MNELLHKVYVRLRALVGIDRQVQRRQPAKPGGTIKVGDKIYTRRAALPNLLANDASHEVFLVDLIEQVLTVNPGCVLDVGVNKGQTLLKLLEIDKNTRYFGFEPQVGTLFGIQTFIEENELNTFKVLPVALGSENGTAKIMTSGPGVFGQLSSPVGSMVEGFRPDEFYNSENLIAVMRGDLLVSSLEIKDISLIKIDVEGAELEVVTGLLGTIAKEKPVILFEVLHHFIAVTKQVLDEETQKFRDDRIQKLEKMIRNEGYSIYQILGTTGLKKVDRIQPKFKNELSTTDYLAVPEETEADFRLAFEVQRTIDQ